VGRDPKSKHPFDKRLDSEQMFVMGWRHGEHRFDASPPGDGRPCRVEKELRTMTALWLDPTPHHLPLDAAPGRRGLRLVEGDRQVGFDEVDESDPWGTGLGVVPDRRSVRDSRRRVSPEVRRRRVLFAVIGLVLVALALPLSGTGGRSHVTGSARVETLATGEYTVQPGDTLWTIVERADPSADPRPLVARLTQQTGSDAVYPGERIALP
jgi:hypothetical protein